MKPTSPIRLMAHLVAGFPDYETGLLIADSLVKGGAHFLEVQFAFTDPSADGPAIQTANALVLSKGFTTARAFEFVTAIHERHPDIPVFIMTYASLVYTPQVKNFVAKAKAAGVAGLIIPDLPFDHDEGLTEACRACGMVNIPVVVPSMSKERLSQIIEMKFPYLYTALRAGITGQKTVIDQTTLDFIRRVSEGGAKVLGGFGISSGEQSQTLAPHVYSVIAGSAFINIVHEHFDETHPEESREKIAKAIEAKARELSGG